mmetsp:Transcript_27083/g.50902  ORF Transcript_27083/g.50902 Transcript_27083/m.50902 type:complete len:577 (-) Transcript_27083:38-1768(-)
MNMLDYLETARLLPRSHGDKEGQDAENPGSVQRFSIGLMLVALCFMYSVHNLIAPNMTAVARLFHFNNYERDAYIGGELTLGFYFSGVFGALVAGVLSGILNRQQLLAVLAVSTSVACLSTARTQTFRQLAWARAMTGFSIGGSLPVVYSLIGDWFPARRRASATAFVTAASGAGVFLGQCVATVAGSVDWRLPFGIIAAPSAITGVMIWYMAEEPARGGQEDGIETHSLYQPTGLQDIPLFSSRQFRVLLRNRTNLLVILQAFPGNIPWGVIIVYIHDFLIQDLGLSTRSALGSITILAGAAFAGVLTGGFIGESLYGQNSRYIALFGGMCNIVRALPFFVLFGWKRIFGSFATSSEMTFFMLLMAGGFIATMASACSGAMLLNVNLPEMRGPVMAMYTVLDDVAKGFGTLFVSMIVPLVGGRAVAYQLSLLLWVFTGIALLYTWHTYEEDEQQMRQNLDEAARESVVLQSKQLAQAKVRERAKAAGAAHFAHSQLTKQCQGGPGGAPQRSALPAAFQTFGGVDSGQRGSSSRGRAPAPNGQLSGAGLAQNLDHRERVRRAARAAAEAAAMSRGR